MALPAPDPRVRLVRNDRPLGVRAPETPASRPPRGAWVAFLDDDDLWAPEKLLAQLREGARTGADFVYAAAVRVDDLLRPTSPLMAPEPTRLLDELIASNVVPAGQSNVIVRRELLERVGGFAPDLSMLADWDMWIRLASQGRAAACHEVLVAYVVHSGSMSMTSVGVSRRELRILESRARTARARGWTSPWGRHVLAVAGLVKPTQRPSPRDGPRLRLPRLSVPTTG